MPGDLRLGEALERYRPLLVLLARIQLNGRVRGKVDASDIVQQTLLEAVACRQALPENSGEVLAWLQRALANNLADVLRGLRRRKRDVSRERSLDASLAESSARLEQFLAAAQSSPSANAVRQEEVLLLADAVSRLSDDQREAVILHHLQGWTLAETARQLERSESAVAGLLHRGLRTLRQTLADLRGP